MEKDIIIADLFSGIGGFSLGLKDAGFNIKHHYFSEIDKYAIANYKHNFKNAEYVGSITDVQKFEKRPNIITFGSPCQDFSLAGKRTGMEGERSSLILEAIRLINVEKPDIFIWENVKGAFSSNDGADFWAIIQAFANIGGYQLEWQLLNTSWVLPQNRERIYLVGHLAERSEPKVFPFSENDFLANKAHRKETKGRIGIQVQPNRVASALNQRMNKMGVDDNYIKITSNTNAGFELATVGDGIRFDHLVENSSGRGRVQKQKSQTIDTGGAFGVILEDNIRRLTENECERLQGFPDDWTKFGDFDGVIKEISSTQRYKLLGNAVTRDIVELIGKRLLNQNPLTK
jgi:DNA (cytosine-5)-methyltransferase 1